MRILGLFALLSKSAEATVFEIDGDQSEFDMLQNFYEETGDDLSLPVAETGVKQTRFGLGQPGGNLSARRQALIRMMFNVLAGNHKKDKSFVRKFFQYGCHCYPGGPDNLLKSGHGRPLDKIDTVCQRHKNCYKCVNAIFNAGRWGIGSVTNCNPENTTYKMILDTTLQTVTCPKDQTLCRKSLCECDLEFATSITGMANFDDEYNPDYLQRNGFDHVNSCPKLSNGNASSELQCCGTKTSFPFVEPLSGKRNECCGSRAFNNDRGECCADDGTDTVRPIGSCTNYQSGYAP